LTPAISLRRCDHVEDDDQVGFRTHPTAHHMDLDELLAGWPDACEPITMRMRDTDPLKAAFITGRSPVADV